MSSVVEYLADFESGGGWVDDDWDDLHGDRCVELVYGAYRLLTEKEDRERLLAVLRKLMRYLKDPGKMKFFKKNWVTLLRVALFFTILFLVIFFNQKELADAQAKTSGQAPSAHTVPQSGAVTHQNGLLPKSVIETTTTTKTSPDPASIPKTGNLPANAIRGEVMVNQVTKQDDLVKLFVSETNILFVKLFGAVAFSAIAAFVLTLPFMRLEQLKLGSLFEYKLQAEKQEEVATQYNKIMAEVEHCRLSILNTTAGDEMYELISTECLDAQNGLLFGKAMRVVTNFAQDIFEQTTDQLLIRAGVVQVEQGRAVESDLQQCHADVRQIIHSVMERGKEDGWDQPTGDYLIVYFYSHKVSFSKADKLMILTAKEMILNHYYAMISDLNHQKIVGIV